MIKGDESYEIIKMGNINCLDELPNSPNEHQKKCMAISKESFILILGLTENRTDFVQNPWQKMCLLYFSFLFFETWNTSYW